MLNYDTSSGLCTGMCMCIVWSIEEARLSRYTVLYSCCDGASALWDKSPRCVTRPLAVQQFTLNADSKMHREGW